MTHVNLFGSFNSLQTGKGVARTDTMSIEVLTAESFNSLLTGKGVASIATDDENALELCFNSLLTGKGVARNCR